MLTRLIRSGRLVSASTRGSVRCTATTLALLIATALTGGCDRSSEAEPPPLLVMAAASLTDPLIALIAQFEDETGMAVDLALGATGSLAVQMEQGAPADIFFSADRTTVERLAASGTIRFESIRNFALGELVVVWRDGLIGPSSIADLADPRFGVVAIANPETAPYGMAAREALERSGLQEKLVTRIVQGESVAQTYQLIRTGNVDAALVARSMVEGDGRPYTPVEPSSHAPIVHAAGILAEGDQERARLLLDFVLGAEGRKILATYGFRPATEGP